MGATEAAPILILLKSLTINNDITERPNINAFVNNIIPIIQFIIIDYDLIGPGMCR